MGENSKTIPIVLTLLAVLVAYAAWSGDGISLIGMSGIKPRMVHADSMRDSLKVLQARIDTAKRDIAKESVEDVTKRVGAYRGSLALLRTLVPEQREVNNMLDDVPVEKVKDFQAKMTDFLSTRKAELLGKIRAEKAFSDPLAAELKAAITEFKQTYR